MDISETGVQIGEKLALLLNEKQQKELAQYLLEDIVSIVDAGANSAKHNWQQDSPLTEIREGDLYLCLEQRLVKVREQEIFLTAKEFDILFLLASNPPYGYVKDPQDKKKWIVDEEAAKVVRRIFDLCIAGKGPMQIAKILTAEKVLTVTAYHARQKGWTMPEHLYQWCAKSVSGILERREYTGCTVNFKTYTKSLKFKKRLQNPKENQRIFEGTQPAIIEHGQWERVQILRENKRRPTKTGKTSMFSGLVRCADCGAKLYYCTSNSYKDDSQDHFVCSNYKSNTGSCRIHYIREITLYKRVLECIQQTLTYVQLFNDDFTQEMLMQDEASRKAELT